jgi:hypothetical protein
MAQQSESNVLPFKTNGYYYRSFVDTLKEYENHKKKTLETIITQEYDIFIFFRNGFMKNYYGFDSFINIEKYLKTGVYKLGYASEARELKSNPKTIYRNKISWSTYSTHKDILIERSLNPDFIAFIGLLQIYKVYEEHYKVLNDSTLMFIGSYRIKNKELKESWKPKTPFIYHFRAFDTKPDSANWINDSKWYRRLRKKSK